MLFVLVLSVIVFVYAGKATISNDGATIMKLLDIVHPAAKTLVEIAKSQDAEVSDGSYPVVLLAHERSLLTLYWVDSLLILHPAVGRQF